MKEENEKEIPITSLDDKRLNWVEKKLFPGTPDENIIIELNGLEQDFAKGVIAQLSQHNIQAYLMEPTEGNQDYGVIIKDTEKFKKTFPKIFQTKQNWIKVFINKGTSAEWPLAIAKNLTYKNALKLKKELTVEKNIKENFIIHPEDEGKKLSDLVKDAQEKKPEFNLRKTSIDEFTKNLDKDNCHVVVFDFSKFHDAFPDISLLAPRKIQRPVGKITWNEIFPKGLTDVEQPLRGVAKTEEQAAIIVDLINKYSNVQARQGTTKDNNKIIYLNNRQEFEASFPIVKVSKQIENKKENKIEKLLNKTDKALVSARTVNEKAKKALEKSKETFVERTKRGERDPEIDKNFINFNTGTSSRTK